MPVRALVLWANDQSPNFGVRALAAGSADLVRRAFPGAEVEFLHHHSPSTAPVRPNTPRSIARELTPAGRGFVEWLSGFDLVVDTRSGDSFADIYGLRRHVVMCGVAELCRRARVPLVLGPQTIGPFGTRRGRLLARRTLHSSVLVMARDPRSAAESERLGRAVDVLTTDVAFALERPAAPRAQRDVVLNVSGLLWAPGPHVDAARYRSCVSEVVQGLQDRHREVGLLAHVAGSSGPDDDRQVVEGLAGELGLEPIVPTSLTEVREVVAGARLVLGSRMHACLNAISVGTPAIPLAYSRKFDPLLAHLGWEHVVDLRDDEDAASSVLRLVDLGEERLGADASRAVESAERLLVPAVDRLRDVVVAHG